MRPGALFAVLLGTLLLAGGCFEKKSVEGNAELEQWRGHWLVINYWAEWCAPCRKEVQELNQLQERLAGSHVRLLGVNYDGLQADALHQAVQRLGIQFPVLTSDPATALGLPRANGLPVTYLVDESGRLRQQWLGAQTADGIQQKLRENQALNDARTNGRATGQ